MKIIDLLNKITNGEELPEKIEYNGITYELDIYGGWQYYIDRVNLITLLERINSVTNLNDEVEIVEEDKKIEKLKDYIKGLLETNEKYKRVYRIEEETEWYSPKWLEQTCNEMLAIINKGDDKE